MKKQGYVIKIIDKNTYVEVLDASFLPCCDLSNLSPTFPTNEGMQLHDCTTCSACSSFLGSKKGEQQLNTIKVQNKEKRQISVGEKIEYSISNWSIFAQVVLFLLLPILTFTFTFSLLFYLGFSESASIFLSFASSILIVLFSSIISRLFLFDVFMPKVV